MKWCAPPVVDGIHSFRLYWLYPMEGVLCHFIQIEFIGFGKKIMFVGGCEY